MDSDVNTSRKRHASASPAGSTSSRISQTASKLKKGVQKGVSRTVAFIRRSVSRSRSRSPGASAHSPSSVINDDFPSLKSASSDASSFYFGGRGDDDDEDDDNEESSHRRTSSKSSVHREATKSSMATGSSADPLDIPSDSDSVDVLTSDAASNASAEEQQSRGRRSRPTAVQKRGGARRSSPTWSPSRLNANKDRERTASSSPPPRRTGRASRPSEKAKQGTSSATAAAAKSTPAAAKSTRKTSPRSSKGRARKKTKKAHNVDISAIPKADNIADDSSDAEAPKKKRAPARHSPMYGFYHPEPKIVYKDTDRAKNVPHEMFKCALCGHRVSRNMTTQDKSSTSGLRLHAEGCFGVEAVRAAKEGNDLKATRELVNKAGKQKQGVLTGLFKSLASKAKAVFSTIPLTTAETRAECARWCAENYRPFKIVADRAFHKLMKTGRPSTYIPHPTTVSRDTKTLFAKTRRRLAKKFKALRCRFHIALDGWTSPNHKAFVAYTVHWEEDGERMSTVLDFRELPESHSGEALAILTKAVLEEFGLDQKILSITSDNASPNDVMMERLVDALPNFGGPRARTRCFAHVINLVAKSLLRLFNQPVKKKGKKDDDADEATAAAVGKEDAVPLEALLSQIQDLESGNVADEDDPDDVYDAFASMTSKDKEQFLKDTKAITSALRKIRTISFKIINSSTILLPRWKVIVADLNLPPKILPRDVSTRWNSTYDMLTTALKYKKAIREITGEDALLDYVLVASEWVALENLCEVLAAFKDATTYFSRADANLATVIPAIDKLDAMLATAVIKKRGDTPDVILGKPMQAALLVAKDTLNKYYNLSDDSELYRIALMLHPKYKTSYFDDHHWPVDWKDSATGLIRRVFNEYLSAYEAATGDSPKTSTTTTSAPAQQANKASVNMFSDDDEPSVAAPVADASNELERYLAADRENVKDVVAWWYKNREKYPVLSRMALDYLSIPPTSVPVERIFSQARILISHIRNRLSAQTARALICLGAWSRDGFVHDDDITAVTKAPIVKDEIGDEEDDVLMPADFDTISRI